MFLPLINKAKKIAKKTSGFTLIELLVVIGILAVLLAIVLIAVNPPRQFALARNTQRRSDALAILNSVGQYFAENGKLPTDPNGNLSGTPTEMGSGVSQVDICSQLAPTYIAEMPVDPDNGNYSTCSSYSTGYNIATTSANRVTISAPGAEDPDGGGNPPTIQVTR